MKENKKTISSYLKEYNGLTQTILRNLNIIDVPIDLFFSTFGKMDPEQMNNFINDNKNAYSLGLFGSRYHNLGNIKAYNGKHIDIINGGRNTLSARRSNYHGH